MPIKVTLQPGTTSEWMVWDTTQAKRDGFAHVVTISKHADYMFGKAVPFYRVDYAGRTLDTLLETKALAVESATGTLRDLIAKRKVV